MKKSKNGVARIYASIKEVYEQTEILSEQTKTALKNIHQEKETAEEAIKSLRSMARKKIDNVSDKKIGDKTITDKSKKRGKTS